MEIGGDQFGQNIVSGSCININNYLSVSKRGPGGRGGRGGRGGGGRGGGRGLVNGANVAAGASFVKVSNCGQDHSHHKNETKRTMEPAMESRSIRETIQNIPMHGRPLVVLLDARDCSVELSILKEIATIGFCDVHHMSEIHPKALNEAFGLILRHPFILTKEDLVKFKQLRIIVKIGGGLDNVDDKAASELGIAVCEATGREIEEVADSTLWFILSLYRRTLWSANEEKVTNGDENPVFFKAAIPEFRRIRGSTLGIIGLGRIGSSVALRAKVFGFNVIFYDPNIPEGIYMALGIERVYTLQDLLMKSDCVSLHCSLNDQTHHIINQQTIRQMKPGAFLINTSSFGLVDEAALAAALKENRISAAALDVHRHHLISSGSPLKDEPNLIVTSHAASYSEATITELREMASREMSRAILGHIPNSLQYCVNRNSLPSAKLPVEHSALDLSPNGSLNGARAVPTDRLVKTEFN